MPPALPSPAPDACVLYLIRHGATANNLAHPPRLQGSRSNPELSEDGRDQARKTGLWLSQASLSAVYSSPMIRAQQTAAPIAAAQGLDVHIVEQLIEIDIGEWEGRDWAEIERSEPEAYRRFIEEPGENPYLGGENMNQLIARVAPALEEIMSSNLGKSIAVVAHNVVNRCYMSHLIGIPMARARSVPQHNCGINVLNYRKGKAKVVTINMEYHVA